jgi:uncharacterized protein (DUF1778 family)
MKRDAPLLLRLTPEEKASFEDAADLSGLTTAGWIRQKLRSAASRELRRLRRKVPFEGRRIKSKSGKNR